MSIRNYLLGLAAILGLFASEAVLAQRPKDNVIFLPLISNFETVATPPPENTATNQIFGQLGRLEKALGQRFDSYFLTTEGKLYAIVGADPQVESELVRLRNRVPVVAVKIWGQLYAEGSDRGDGLIVVSGVLESGLVESIAGPLRPVAIGKFSLVNIYGGPDRTFPRVGQVTAGQTCDVVGRNLDSSWWQLDCGRDLLGWIDARLVTVAGDLFGVSVTSSLVLAPTPIPSPTPVVAPTLPAPTPTPVESRSWRAAYYNNTQLLGAALNTTNVDAIDFSWGSGAPLSGVPSDNFSVRFERRVNFAPVGYYRFTVEADDGIRVWLDDQLLIDEWHGSSNQSFIVGRTLSGVHDLRVDYFEASGLAYVRFEYDYIGQLPDWDAAYFNGSDLRGVPVLRQQEPRSILPLDYNWGYSGPTQASGLGADYWSARWVGRFRFDAGDYQFKVISDDGVRLYLNDLLVIDSWRDGYKEPSNRVIGIGAGDHTIRVEYYERTGLASLRVWWYRENTPATAQ